MKITTFNNINFASIYLSFKIVSTAPPHTSSTSFSKLTIDNFTNKNNDIDVNTLVRSLKCIQDAFGNAVGKSSLKQVYEEYQDRVEAHIKYELVKCSDLENNLHKKFKFV